MAKTPRQTSLARAVVHIRERWMDGASLKEIAHLYDVDPGNLSRDFYRTEGLTPKQYLNERRIRHILSRLATNNVLGYQLADELGFPTDISFYRWTKRVAGISFLHLRENIHTGDPDTTLLARRGNKKRSMNFVAKQNARL